MLEALEKQFTKYELARIIGARALQIAMDAPLLLKIDEKELESINYNPIEIAKRELLAEVLPITVNKPLPKKKETKIKKLTKEELEAMQKKEEEQAKEAETEKEGKAAKKVSTKAQDNKDDKDLDVSEEVEEKKVTEDAEIMELSRPEDEEESTEAPGEGTEEA